MNEGVARSVSEKKNNKQLAYPSSVLYVYGVATERTMQITSTCLAGLSAPAPRVPMSCRSVC